MLETKVVAYPAPNSMGGAAGYRVQVNEIPLFLYQARVNFSRVPDMDLFPEWVPIAYFDMQGEVSVRIETDEEFGFVDIRPKSYGITPFVDGNAVVFQLSNPKKITIEFDGDLHRTVHLFANPIEEDAPDPNDPSVVYFGPGIHHPGVISLESNRTVYLAGGAYVYGIVRGDGVEGACVRGRGILSGEKAPWPNGVFQVKNCRSLVLRDFILLDSAGWSVKIDACEDVFIENFKEICYRRNCDGIDLCSTKDAVVNDCFVRNWDDAFCIKGIGHGDSKNTRVTNCVFWSDAAQSIEIGYETQMDRIEDVLIKNIDIIHHLMPGYMCLTVHNGDRARISNLRFEEIRIEDTVAPVFDVWLGKANWNRDETRGHIRDVYFKNISLIGGPDPALVNQYKPLPSGESELSPLSAVTSRVFGFSPEHTVEDITFENVNLLGKFIGKPEDGNFQVNSFTGGLKFLPPADGSPIVQYTLEPEEVFDTEAMVIFDASGSSGQDAELISFAWSFGDGTFASGTRVQHVYDHAGNFTVELTVCDLLGRTSKIMRILPVLPAMDAVVVDQPKSGLRTRYMEGDFNFASDLDAVSPAFTGMVPGCKAPARTRPNYRALVYSGFIAIPTDGIYSFLAGVEFGTGYDMLAGGAIYVHGRLVSANNSGWGRVGLKAGFHPIKITEFKKSGGKQVYFKYMGPGIEAQEIPDHAFFIPESGEEL